MRKISLLLASLLLASASYATTTIAISVDIPDADAVDVLAAHRTYFATNAIPSPSNAQIIAAMKARLIAEIKAVTRAYRNQAATNAISDPVAN